MAYFSKADASKIKYIIALVDRIKKKEKIKFKEGNLTVELTPEIKALEKAAPNVSKCLRIIYANNKPQPIFKTSKGSFSFTAIDKAPFSKMGGGKIDAVSTKQQEICSMKAIEATLNKNGFKDINEFIKVMYDDLKKIYKNIDEPWLNTFYQQGVTILKEVGRNRFTDYSRDVGFMDFITKLVKTEYGIVKKDSWNPADIWLIENSQKQRSLLAKFVKDNVTDIAQFNDILRAKFKTKEIVGISLKKMSGKQAKYELVNVKLKGSVFSDDEYNFKTDKINCYLKFDKKFKSTDTIIEASTPTQRIIFQIRPNTGGISNLKFEATMKGSQAARLGKVPLPMLKILMSKFGLVLDNSHGNYPKTVSEFEERMKEFTDIFKKTKHLINTDVSNEKEFQENMNMAFTENPIAAYSKLMQLDFLSKIGTNLDDIVTSMSYLAQKKGDIFGPFGKLY